MRQVLIEMPELKELCLSDLKKGYSLPVLKKNVTLEHIQQYARVSGDLNPLHVDENFARHTTFGGIVAHGMLTLAYISEMMAGFFGEDWFSTGHMDVRFKQAARPGDELTINGNVLSVIRRKTGTTVTCDVHGENQNNQSILIGTCRVRVFGTSRSADGRIN